MQIKENEKFISVPWGIWQLIQTKNKKVLTVDPNGVISELHITGNEYTIYQPEENAKKLEDLEQKALALRAAPTLEEVTEGTPTAEELIPE